MERIYHPYWKWEDHQAGFYENQSGETQKVLISKVVEMFNDYDLTLKYMNKVISEWTFSCEHNLTNESMNKIAYIGQSAACLYCGASFKTTIVAWNLLEQNIQHIANEIALSVLNKWGVNHV